MNMKKIISACMALLVVSLTACNDFLDEPMKGNLNTESIYSSPEEAQLAVNGIYNASTYFINLWRFGDVASDDAVKGGNEGDMSDLNYIIDFTASADNGILSEFWQNTYEVVSCANNVIGNVPGMTSASQTQKDNFVAQAKFFRALAYFTLVNIYGEVPLKLLPQNSPETINVPLSSVESIYTQIEKDLTDAAPSLEINPVEQGRVTRGAAYGLLAKVYLYQQKYSEALSAIANVESLDIYELEKDYADLFKWLQNREQGIPAYVIVDMTTQDAQVVRLEEGKTIIFSTHDLDIAMARSDAMALIDSPALIMMPTGEMRRSGHLERLFGIGRE